MSNNIETIHILSSDGFCINKKDLAKLAKQLEDDVPACSIFDGWPERQDQKRHINDDGLPVTRVYPKNLWWSGEWSGRTVDVFTSQVLTAFDGTADIIIVYESGAQEGYRLRDHKVTQHEVIVTLGDEL